MRGMESEQFYLLARTVYAFAWATMVTVSLVFMVEVAGLDPLQMVLHRRNGIRVVGFQRGDQSDGHFAALESAVD